MLFGCNCFVVGIGGCSIVVYWKISGFVLVDSLVWWLVWFSMLV